AWTRMAKQNIPKICWNIVRLHYGCLCLCICLRLCLSVCLCVCACVYMCAVVPMDGFSPAAILVKNTAPMANAPLTHTHSCQSASKQHISADTHTHTHTHINTQRHIHTHTPHT